MRLLSLLVKVAFICNICFLLASLVQWLPNPPEGIVLSYIILMGYVLAILINVVVNGWVAFLWVAGKWQKSLIPRWLLVINALFFLIQLILILIHIVR